MKRLLVVLVSLACLAPDASAQVKIATVNLRRIFDGYWRTKAASADLKGRTDKYDEDFRRLIDQYQKANEAYRQLVSKFEDQSLSAEDRKKLENTGRAKVTELREMEVEINQFLQHSRTILGDKQQRLRSSILAEINNMVTVKARAGNFDLVLDVSGETSNGAPTVQYTNGKNDLTDAVLEALNTGAPAEPVKPEGTAEPAPTKEEKKEEKKPDKK
jgi:outer membrane protein